LSYERKENLSYPSEILEENKEIYNAKGALRELEKKN